MRKLNYLLSVLILTSSMPALAVFCTNCGKNMPEDANFCSACGKAVNGAFQTAEPESKKAETTTTVGASISTVVKADSELTSDNQALAEYNFINQIESYLAKSTSNVALSQCYELKRQNAGKLQKMNNDYLGFSLYRRKIHDLHIAKLEALENYLEARKNCDSGGDTAIYKAQMCKELFKVDKMNEAIDKLLTGGNSLVNLNKVEELEKRVKKTTANYIVTSQYLNLGNVRIKRNEPIWIEDVSGASAKVYHMGNGVGDEPASGLVSIYDLEKRSNWTVDSDFFYSAPAGTTVVVKPKVQPEHVSVFVWDGVYPYSRWHHRPICWPGPRHMPPPPPPHKHPRPPHKHPRPPRR